MDVCVCTIHQLHDVDLSWRPVYLVSTTDFVGVEGVPCVCAHVINKGWSREYTLLLVECYPFNHNTAISNTFTTTYYLGFVLWYTVICTFYCHTICKHLGFHNVHLYWMYLQYGLWIGLVMARWAETCCQIYRLIIKLFVVFRQYNNIYLMFLLDDTTGWPP